MTELTGEWLDATQASAHFSRVVRPWCHEQWKAGRKIAVHLTELEDARSIQQLRYLWGVVYKETSEQARIDGVQYTPDAWHELGKRLHLPRAVKKIKVAGRSRPVVTTSIGTLKGISVRKMSLYIEKFTAWAVTDFGVRFSLAKWEDYR